MAYAILKAHQTGVFAESFSWASLRVCDGLV
jgi:hypothetical protein